MDVRVAEGAVVVLGPDVIAASLTPEAAEDSAERLRGAARRAREARGAPPPAIDPKQPIRAKLGADALPL